MIALRRYTNLAAAIYLLREKRITLLNPATWDDKNDAFFMAEYKRYLKAKTVLALCFAEQSETYHHWRVFSHGSDGVCIEFDKEKLMTTFVEGAHIKKDLVRYKKVSDLKKLKKVKVDQLPFLKRYPYKDEREYRIIYVNKSTAYETKEYKIQIGWISRITLNPWMPKALKDSVITLLKTIKGCSHLKIYQTTLVNNEKWKRLTQRIQN